MSILDTVDRAFGTHVVGVTQREAEKDTKCDSIVRVRNHTIHSLIGCVCSMLLIRTVTIYVHNECIWYIVS